MTALNSSFWTGRRVFITGHMGFKGAWLTRLLSRLGAPTIGFGRDDRVPLLYRELSIADHTHIEGDVTQLQTLTAALVGSEAEIVFHLAAQPLVLTSYEQPIRTFADNIMGTANLLEAARRAPRLKAVVIVTSDKVYRNNEWNWAYRENEPLGGSDPYSASKAAAEIVTQGMIASFFSPPGSPLVACARAGNVIGGGDWAEHRILPDAARALAAGQDILVRNPHSVRPWQHVLDPLSGYLTLAQALVEDGAGDLTAWNFGPSAEDAMPVATLADLFTSAWGRGARWRHAETVGARPKEATHLAIDASLARSKLGWRPRWRVVEAVTRTAHWYRDHAAGGDAQDLVDRDIDAFVACLEERSKYAPN